MKGVMMVSATLLLYAGCVAPSPPDHLTELQRSAAEDPLDLSHGVSEVAAYKLAWQYFASVYPEALSHPSTASPRPMVPVEGQNEWKVTIMIGDIVAFPFCVVYIDKKTGNCRCMPSIGMRSSVGDQTAAPTGEIDWLTKVAEVRLGFSVTLQGPCSESFLNERAQPSEQNQRWTFAFEKSDAKRLIDEIENGCRVFTFQEMTVTGPFIGEWGYVVFKNGAVVEVIVCGVS